MYSTCDLDLLQRLMGITWPMLDLSDKFHENRVCSFPADKQRTEPKTLTENKLPDILIIVVEIISYLQVNK